MKEMRTFGLIPFVPSIIQLRIQRFLLLQSKTPSDAVFNLRLFNFPIFFMIIKKMKRKLLEMNAAM